MDALQLIAGPRRREILGLVADRELAAGEIAQRLGMGFSATSQHLAKLREAGVVVVRREGRQRFYRTNRERLDELAGVLGAMWRDDIDRLAGLAEARAQGSSPPVGTPP